MKKSNFVKDFRNFIERGSAIDMAVGIIVGGVMTSVVNSLVKDIIMPPIGLLVGGVDFSQLFVVLSGGVRRGKISNCCGGPGRRCNDDEYRFVFEFHCQFPDNNVCGILDCARSGKNARQKGRDDARVSILQKYDKYCCVQVPKLLFRCRTGRSTA